MGSISIAPQKQLGLIESKKLGHFFGTEKVIEGKTFPPIIHNAKFYSEYVVHKR